MSKLKTMLLVTALVALALPLHRLVAQDTQNDIEAPDEVKAVPQAKLAELASLVQIPPGSSRREAIEFFKNNAPKAIEMGRQIEKQYPEAENLHEVRGFMLQMASMLAEQTDDPAWQETTEDVAKRMLQGNPSPDVKAYAKSYLTQLDIARQDLKGEDAKKAIEDYVQEFEGTPAAPQAMIRAIMLAISNQQPKLADAMAKRLEENYLTSPGVARFLRQQLRRDISFVGRPFDVTLRQVDGSKLELPEDLKGKVVVVDFWATWCPPCRASLPKLKEFYDDYKGKGVEIVGISLDYPDKLDQLKKFIAENDLKWIHTYSGEYWNDPTASSYGLPGIPSIWVLDKQGRIYAEHVSTVRGYDKLRSVVDEVLAGKTAEDKLADAK